MYLSNVGIPIYLFVLKFKENLVKMIEYTFTNLKCKQTFTNFFHFEGLATIDINKKLLHILPAKMHSIERVVLGQAGRQYKGHFLHIF